MSRRKYISIFSFLIFLFLSIVLNGQKEGNIWYFGNQAGLDFKTSPPTVLSDGVMNTSEGCASISDTSGKLLFYSDGIKVWNKNHLQMPNGFGLMGHSSSTQSAVIVPHPGNKFLYYLFTVIDVARPNGVRYSLIDMRLNGGLGDVVSSEKNVLLLTPSCEKIVAINHRNNRDIWVIIHGWNNSNFYSYLVTNNGLNTTPVISTSGSNYGSNLDNALGQLRVSPNGKKILNCNWGNGTVELYDFNNLTGEVSNPMTLPNIDRAYGCEFSGNCNYIYVAECKGGNAIYQFDISSNNQAIISSSKKTVATTGNGQYGQLQLGPDNKIYVAILNSLYLGVFNEPDKPGLSCDFVAQGQYLDGKRSRFGLPTFIQSYFSIIPEYEIDIGCQNNISTFEYLSDFDSLRWDFGDGKTSGNQINKYYEHLYIDTGDFQVKLTIWLDDISEIINILVRVNHNHLENQFNEICQGDTLFIGTNFYTKTGVYSDTFKNSFGCDSIVISNLKVHKTDTTIIDYLLCIGDSIMIDSFWFYEFGTHTKLKTNKFGCDSIVLIRIKDGKDSFKQFFESCRGFEITVGNNIYYNSGIYIDTLTSSIGCDSIVTTILKINENITTFNTYRECEGFVLTVGNSTYTKTGNYFDIINPCDTIFSELTILPLPSLNYLLSDDSCRQEQGSITITSLIGTPPFSFNWQDGNMNQNLNNIGEGLYTLTLTDSNFCSSTTQITVSNNQLGCDFFIYIPTAFSPNGDFKNEVFLPSMYNITAFKMDIYNRWGEQIFSSSKLNEGWDGTYKGKPCKQDVYTVIISYTSESEPGKIFKQKSTLTLLR